MDLKFVPKFSQSDIDKQIQKIVDEQNREIENNLFKYGEMFVKAAWENADFLNHTFDLRSSIGFGVVRDGQIVRELFRTIATGANGSETGSRVLEQAVNSLSLKEGFALVVVAGMGYAAAVESHGRDVITGTGHTIETLLRQVIGNPA